MSAPVNACRKKYLTPYFAPIQSIQSQVQSTSWYNSFLSAPAQCSMQSALAGGCHVGLAVDHHLDHGRDVLQTRENDLVALDELVAVVLETCLLGKGLDKF